MTCAALPLEIARNELTHCFYLALRCRQHAEVPVALPAEPIGQSCRCPICNTLCEYLGEGGTQRQLPFWREICSETMMGEGIRRFWMLKRARQSSVEG